MPTSAREGLDFARQVLREFSDDDCATIAASLAYYIVLSLAPLLLVVIVVAGLVIPADVAGEAVYEEFRMLIGEQGAEQVRVMTEHVQQDRAGNIIARVMGVVLVVFGATGVMLQLQRALNRAWNVKPAPSAGIRTFIVKRLLSLAMILGMGFLLLVSLVLSAMASAAAGGARTLLPEPLSGAALQGMDVGVSLVVITFLFAAIFKLLPEARVRWRDVFVGASVTAVLFIGGKFAIGLYLGNSNVGSAYGAASSLAILFVWVYYSSIIVLLGAEFTQVWTRRFGAGITPREGAVLGDKDTAPAR